MLLRSQQVPRSADAENPYWISFSDIMAGLLVIFILAALALILELTQTRMKIDEAIKDLMEAEEIRRELLKEVQDALGKKGIEVIISGDSSVIHINDQVLSFDTDRAEIPDDPDVKTRLLEIGRVLHEAITKNDRMEYLDTIFIEGHTDPRRSTRYKSMGGNWTLSTLRAISVWGFWEETLAAELQLTKLKNYQDELLFSASGYAATRPAKKIVIDSGETTDQDLRADRRIDLRFTLKRASSDEFAAVRALAE